MRISRYSGQVAHDIRSPLAALDSIAGNVAKLPEEERLIIRSAVGRIRDIANHLLEKHRKDKVNNVEDASVCLLSSLIEPLITEKRLQFRSRHDVEIETFLDAASYGHFAKIEPIEFKRLLSNLVNNSVEALETKGSVILSLAHKDQQILIKIQDTGKGIPPEILAKLGGKGETHGKTGGSGLGLYHARTALQCWGGSLKIKSQVGQGATITIILPRAEPPSWFVSELELSPKTPIVVLDDDPTIHQVWQGRLNAINLKDQDIEVVHFSRPDEIREWAKTNASAAARKALYLMDYELLGFKETGLALIEELNLGYQAILVTSRYEEKDILKNCQRLGVRLIPKGLAGFVPIKVMETGEGQSQRVSQANIAPEPCDAILIDDDPLVRMTWTMAAKRAGKNLLAFVSAEEFFKKTESLSRNTPIYIDSRLGNGVKGEEESQKIYKLGFKEIYLATGDSPEKFAHLKHIRGVLGKEPPWVEIPT
ncbi:MAG: hypothetical protein HY547_02585 [Elusimicrobia bacterium]|nr:hypothetical protein [Elusimicrobiota bacterium]